MGNINSKGNGFITKISLYMLLNCGLTACRLFRKREFPGKLRWPQAARLCKEAVGDACLQRPLRSPDRLLLTDRRRAAASRELGY
jgi:hypothetical protein